MNLKAYKDILNFSKEKIAEAKAPICVMRMKKRAEGEVLELETRIMDIDGKIDDECTKYPINFDRLIELIDEKEIMERWKGQFATIIGQLFPSDSTPSIKK